MREGRAGPVTRARACRWPLGVVLLAMLAACQNVVTGQAGVATAKPATTAQVVGQSLVDLAEAGALHVTGGLTTLAGDKIGVDLRVASTGEALGTLTLNKQHAKVVLLGKTPYLNGPAAFWAALPGIPDAKSTVVADRWVSVPPALLGVQIEDLFSPSALAQLLGDGPEPTAQQPPERNRHQRVGGVDALAINLSAGTVYLAATAPYPVAGAKLASVGTSGPSAARDVTLTVTDATNDLPALYRDLDQQATKLTAPVDLLTPIREGAYRFTDDCGPASCAVVVDLTNDAKVAVRVSVSANWIGDDKPLGRCDTETGPVPPGKEISATCTISTPEWTAFYQRAHTVPGQHPYRAEWSAVSLTEPPDRAAVHAHATAKAPREADKDGAYVVYALDHADGAKRVVWKFGVVSRGSWRDQAARQLAVCQTMTGRMCTFHLVTSADDAAAAYLGQRDLVRAYRDEAERCPAGQAVGCRQ